MERDLKPQTFHYPDSIKCSVCGKFGKGPIVRENGEVVVIHRVSRPADERSGAQTNKRSVVCVIRGPKA